KVGRGHQANRLIGCSDDRTRCSVVRNCGAKEDIALSPTSHGAEGMRDWSLTDGGLTILVLEFRGTVGLTLGCTILDARGRYPHVRSSNSRPLLDGGAGGRAPGFPYLAFLAIRTCHGCMVALAV